MRLFIIFTLASTSLLAQDLTTEQKEILKSIDALSKSTSPDGEGAQAYAELLSNDFSRWTMGGKEQHTKETWVNGIRDWFEDGWRVVDRSSEIVSFKILNTYGFVRRLVSETYVGPDGKKTDPSKAAVSEVWSKEESVWKLLRVEVTALNQ